MKLFKTLTLTCLSTSFALAQNVNQDQTTRNFDKAPPATVSSGNSNSNGNVGASDTGAQRPIFLNTEQISAFAGFDTKYFLRTNPTTKSGTSKYAPSYVWQNSFYGGASLSPIDTDTAVLTPIFGGSWTMTDYLRPPDKKGDLSDLNDYATSAYALLMIQHESGIGFRAGVSYASVRNNKTDTEDYSEFYPNVGAMKTYGLGPDTLAIVDISGGLHLSESAGSFFVPDTDTLDNWDASLSLSIRHQFLDFIITPNYRMGYKKFINSINDGRKDVSHAVSLKVDYQIIENVNLTADTSYSRRNSSVESYDDYKNVEGGAKIGINYKF